VCDSYNAWCEPRRRWEGDVAGSENLVELQRAGDKLKECRIMSSMDPALVGRRLSR